VDVEGIAGSRPGKEQAAFEAVFSLGGKVDIEALKRATAHLNKAELVDSAEVRPRSDHGGTESDGCSNK
jgi:hypothetical protein